MDFECAVFVLEKLVRRFDTRIAIVTLAHLRALLPWHVWK